jgi:FKBP-type peptidyl-prolyl cis-trans isomerase
VPTTDHGIKIIVGMGNVIEGWDMGLLTMRLGEQCDLFLIPKYAFGDEGRPPKIPGKAKVIFRMELLQIGDRKSQKP